MVDLMKATYKRRLNYLLKKEKVCCLDKIELFELEELIQRKYQEENFVSDLEFEKEAEELERIDNEEELFECESCGEMVDEDNLSSYSRGNGSEIFCDSCWRG